MEQWIDIHAIQAVTRFMSFIVVFMVEIAIVFGIPYYLIGKFIIK